jgi:hypothetical protein
VIYADNKFFFLSTPNFLPYLNVNLRVPGLAGEIATVGTAVTWTTGVEELYVKSSLKLFWTGQACRLI